MRGRGPAELLAELQEAHERELDGHATTLSDHLCPDGSGAQACSEAPETAPRADDWRANDG
jgi:hypothetical protein